ASRAYGAGFAHRRQEISDVEIDVGAANVRALVKVHEARQAGLARTGFSAHYEPALSPVDSVVVPAQLSQALMYDLEGGDRRETGTLWMRRLGMVCRTPYRPLMSTLMASARVAKSRRLDRSGIAWRMYDLICQLPDIEVSAALAFSCPATTDRQTA